MEGGTKLPEDIRRQSTYLHAAHLAKRIVEEQKYEGAYERLTTLFEEWIGEDWRTLIAEIDETAAKAPTIEPITQPQ